MGNHLTQCAPSHRRTSPPMGGASHLTGARGDHLTLHVPSHRGTSHLMGGNIISHYISPHKRTSHMGGGSITSHRRKITSHKVSPHKRNISYEGASQLTGENHKTCPLTQRHPLTKAHHISLGGRITSHYVSPLTGTFSHILSPHTGGHLLTHGITFHGGRAITSKDVSPLHEDISHRGTSHKGEGIASHGENHLMMCPLIQEDIPSHGVTLHHHISWRGRDITSHYVPPQMGTSHMTRYLTHTSPHTRCLLTQRDISSHKASHFMGEEKSPHMMCPLTKGASQLTGGTSRNVSPSHRRTSPQTGQGEHHISRG